MVGRGFQRRGTGRRRRPVPVEGGNLKRPVRAPQIQCARTAGPDAGAPAGPITARASLAAACSSCARWRKLLPSSGRNAGVGGDETKAVTAGHRYADPAAVDGDDVGVGARVLHLLGLGRLATGRQSLGGGQAPPGGARSGSAPADSNIGAGAAEVGTPEGMRQRAASDSPGQWAGCRWLCHRQRSNDMLYRFSRECQQLTPDSVIPEGPKYQSIHSARRAARLVHAEFRPLQGRGRLIKAIDSIEFRTHRWVEREGSTWPAPEQGVRA